MAGSNLLVGRPSLRSESPLASVTAGFLRTVKLVGRFFKRSSKETTPKSHATRDFWSHVTASDQFHYIIILILASSLLLSLYFASTGLIRNRLGADCDRGYLGGSASSLHLSEEYKSSNELRGCILMIDSRFRNPGPSTLLGEVKKQLRYVEEFRQQSSKQREKLESLVKEASYYSAARTINWLYARKFNYSFVATGGEEFITERHPSWKKLPFIKRHLSCCCRWALFLDSDAFLRMDKHTVSLEAWVARFRHNEAYFQQQDPRRNLSSQVWLPQDPGQLLQPEDGGASVSDSHELVALFPRNGDQEGGFGGWPGCLWVTEDYMNAGVGLFRRSPSTIRFLDCWWQQSRSNRTQLFGHPWEQLRLNVFSATVKDRVALVPYRELTGPDGRMIRHLWSDTGDARESAMRGELREALVLHGLLKSRGIFNWF